MKKLTLSLLSGLALTGALSQLQAQVDLALENIGVSTARNAKFSNLNTTIDSSGSMVASSGSFTATDFGVSEGFTIKTQALNDWNINDPLGTGSAASFNGSTGAWGVIGGGDTTAQGRLINGSGEALVLNFLLDNLSDPSLSVQHQSDFRLNEIYLDVGIGDVYNYAVIVGGTVVDSAVGQTSGTLSLGAFSDIGDDGQVIIGWNAGDFTFTGLQVDVVPEPSAYALIGGCLALSSVMLRRRR